MLLTAIVSGAVVVAQRTAPEQEAEQVERQEPVSLSAPDLPSDSREVVAYGTVRMKLYIDLSDAEISMISREYPGFFDHISLVGWQREGRRFFRTAPAQGLTLHLGEHEVRLASERYAIVVEKGTASDERRRLQQYFEEERRPIGRSVAQSDQPFSLTLRGVRIPQRDIEVTNVDLGFDESFPINVDLVENISYRELKAHSHGGSHGPMERCMDYNGPMSNGKNYSITNARAWVNFVCSDCDLAGAGRCVSCWNDHRVGGCQKNHGKVCSYYIGHSSSYHKHKWSQCRYCL
jgi:hypothetical protein